MPWAKLDDRFYDHPKVVAAGTLGAGLFVLALSYAANKLTDGFVDARMIRRLCADVDDPLALADGLVDAGLFDRVDGGYQIHDYLDYNPTAEKVLAERDAARARMQAFRSGELRANANGTPEDVHPLPHPVPVPDNSLGVPSEAHAPTLAKQPERKPRTRDERLKHPAILCYKGITGRWPHKAVMDDVIRVLGDSPDGERAANCYREWVRRGNKETNYAPFLEWYATGIPERGNGQPRASPTPSPPVRKVRKRVVNSLTGESWEGEVAVSDGENTS